MMGKVSIVAAVSAFLGAMMVAPVASQTATDEPSLPGIAEVGIAYGKFDTLFTLITNAGLAGALEVEGPVSKFYIYIDA